MTLVPPVADAGDDVPIDTTPPVIPVDSTPVPDSSTVATLVITDPWQLAEFNSGVAGWDPIVQGINQGPADTADQVIAVGATCGVTIESR